MAIIQVGPNDDPFSRVPKALLDDERLSFKAKGVMSYLLGHPSNWEVRVRDLVNKSSDGVTAVLSALKELREFGYATLKTIRSRDGKFYSKQWTIYRHPQSGFPFTDNPNTGNPFTENPCINKNEITKKKRKKNDELPASGAIGKSPLYELVNHPVKHKTGFSEAINLFHAFAKGRNFHTRGEKQGKTIYVKNAHEGGWRRQALLEWESRYQALLKRTGSEERIIKTLKWFIANFDNPWVPHCEAFSTFADRFGSIDKMRRRETGESQAFRNGEHRGKNGAPKIKYDIIDGRKVANYEEFV